MTILAQGITFKVKLDVEGAKEDLHRANVEQEKAEAAVKSREPRGGTGAGIAGGFAARTAMTGAAAAGAAWTIDKAFEQLAPQFWAFVEGVTQKTAMAEFTKIARQEAERNAQKVAEIRNAYFTSPAQALARTKDFAVTSALLGGGGLGPEQAETIAKEQYKLALMTGQLRAAQERLRNQLEARGYGQAVGSAVDSAIKSISSLW
jgi:hypothetical protein